GPAASSGGTHQTMSNFDAGALETTVSESSNPIDGRPSGSRSYGEAPAAVHSAATQTQTAPTAAPPFPTAAPVPTPVTAGVGASSSGATSQFQPATEGPDSRRSGSGLTGPAEGVRGALTGAGRSFARVGAAIGSATQESRQNRPASGPGGPVVGHEGLVRAVYRDGHRHHRRHGDRVERAQRPRGLQLAQQDRGRP